MFSWHMACVGWIIYESFHVKNNSNSVGFGTYRDDLGACLSVVFFDELERFGTRHAYTSLLYIPAYME